MQPPTGRRSQALANAERAKRKGKDNMKTTLFLIAATAYFYLCHLALAYNGL